MQKKYQNKNKEKISNYKKKYRIDNIDFIKEREKNYRGKNKKQIKENKKNYRFKNRIILRELNRIHCEKRRSRSNGLSSTLTIQQWQTIKLYFDNKCAYCGKKEKLEQEHFVALSKGGEYTHNNIIPACRSCNSSKWNKDFFEWYPNYKYYNKKREKYILKYLNYNSMNAQQLRMM